MRHLVFAAEVLKDLCGRSPFAPAHGCQPLFDAFNRFGIVQKLKQFLVGRRVLHDKLSTAIDRQDFWPSGLFQAFNVFLGMSLKLGQRINIVKVHHRASMNMQLPVYCMLVDIDGNGKRSLTKQKTL
jgi:hypothetical protein